MEYLSEPTPVIEGNTKSQPDVDTMPRRLNLVGRVVHVVLVTGRTGRNG